MPIEVELKAWVDDAPAMAARLDAEATFVKEAHKRDIYFRLPAGPMGHLRLRREGENSTVTLKDKTYEDGVEINREDEFTVSDAQAFCRMLERFGFEPYSAKQKRSRVYRAGRVTLELSEVTHLGHFIEIEILCDDDTQVDFARRELAVWLTRLGIEPDAIEATPYTKLLREQHPARYVFDLDDPVALVHEESLDDTGS